MIPDLSRLRLKIALSKLASLSEQEVAKGMMAAVAKEQRRYGQLIPNHWYGYELAAIWWEWDSTISKFPEMSVIYAMNLRKKIYETKS